jgi:hypothetical protein
MQKFLILLCFLISFSALATSQRYLEGDYLYVNNHAGTLTFPVATDTFSLLSATQTLSHKSMDGSVNSFSNIPQTAISGITGTNTQDVSLGTANGLTLSGQQLSMTIGSGSATGTISPTDWNTFNNKASTAALSNYLLISSVGVANGAAALDGSGKISVSALPSVVMEYQGTWTPSSNTPALADTGCTTTTNGNVYWITAAYSPAISGLNDSSMINFQLGNLVMCSSLKGKWQQTTPAAGVSSVNGSQGAVTVSVSSIGAASATNTINGYNLSSNPVLTKTDVGLSSVTNDAQVKKSDFSAKGDILVGTGSATYNNLGVGTNGYVLTASSSAADGVAWVATAVTSPSLNGGSGSPESVTAAGGITLSSIVYSNKVWVAGNGGPVTVTKTPNSITPCTSDGQTLEIEGTSAVNTVTLQSQESLGSSGLELNGSWVGGQYSTLGLHCNITLGLWVESFRR